MGRGSNLLLSVSAVLKLEHRVSSTAWTDAASMSRAPRVCALGFHGEIMLSSRGSTTIDRSE
jgi:hypothetical protein